MLLEKLVQFFYSLNYSDVIPVNTDTSPLQLHAKMFGLADEYGIPGLLPVAARKYLAQCVDSWEPSEFLTSIPDVYDAAPARVTMLRRIVCTAIRRVLPELLNEEAVAERYRKTLAENPEFATDLLQSYIDNPLYLRCPYCKIHEYMETTTNWYIRCKRCSGVGR
jgi:speckle-type POZ protein